MFENKITIVTAFFPINREKWKGFERSNNKYMDNFKFWARIKNDMVIYTTEEFYEDIKNIRKEFNRENTKIIKIEDFRKIDEELYKSMDKIAKNKISREFRLSQNNPEVWNTDYDYIMLLKEWCVQDAVKNEYAKGMIAWIDFGYNHGGVYYKKPEEFDFEWKYNFSEKIHLFQINEFDDLPIFEICRRMNSYIIGGVIVAPDNLWNELWNLVRENMLCLNKCGLIDDDQTLLLMSYYQKPELFELHPTKWFSTIKDFSDVKFSVEEPNEHTKVGFIENKKRRFYYKKKIIKYLYKWYKIFKNEEVKG